MFVLCNNCKNHYDDACQSKRCFGPGGSGYGKSHNLIGTPPITQHLNLTKAAHMNAAHAAAARTTPMRGGGA